LASQFKVTPRTILEHLFKCASNGYALRAEGLGEYSRLDPVQRAKVLEAFEKLGSNYLKPVFDALNGEVSYDELHVLRLYHLSLQNRGGGAAPA
ncbi:MAG: helix-turn-helix domain-containing protein, partial [bacterium]